MDPIPEAFIARKSNRPALVAKYVIAPIRRFQCLPGNPVGGLYRAIYDIAYQFTAQQKFGANPKPFTFYTGQPSGDDFLALTKKTLPPLQTWEVFPGGSGAGIGGTTGASTAVHPFNAQLLQALNLFFMKYECDPLQPSGRVYTLINANPAMPQHSGAATLNTVLTKYRETTTSLVAAMTLAFGTRPVRPLTFDLLHDELLAKGITPVAFQ